MTSYNKASAFGRWAILVVFISLVLAAMFTLEVRQVETYHSYTVQADHRLDQLLLATQADLAQATPGRDLMCDIFYSTTAQQEPPALAAVVEGIIDKSCQGIPNPFVALEKK